LLTLYKPNAPQTDTTRFDLPNETFRITLANLPQTTQPPTITAYDPLRGAPSRARLVSHRAGTATIEVMASDYPRVLSITVGKPS
ncbi:MAG TPA: hypothetical protein VHU13_03460, partial [Solirubrobacteraceae bacterium]|nr:hypothetical protein [Solirubrobacteraceae bacterium]